MWKSICYIYIYIYIYSSEIQKLHAAVLEKTTTFFSSFWILCFIIYFRLNFHLYMEKTDTIRYLIKKIEFDNFQNLPFIL